MGLLVFFWLGLSFKSYCTGRCIEVWEVCRLLMWRFWYEVWFVNLSRILSTRTCSRSTSVKYGVFCGVKLEVCIKSWLLYVRFFEKSCECSHLFFGYFEWAVLDRVSKLCDLLDSNEWDCWRWLVGDPPCGGFMEIGLKFGGT